MKSKYQILRIRQHWLIWGGGGGKALTMTMTMTPWNLPTVNGQKKLTMTMTPSILPMVNGQN